MRRNPQSKFNRKELINIKSNKNLKLNTLLKRINVQTKAIHVLAKIIHVQNELEQTNFNFGSVKNQFTQKDFS
jgi:hypothetical protein